MFSSFNNKKINCWIIPAGMNIIRKIPGDIAHTNR
jgi:hypothetical protein